MIVVVAVVDVFSLKRLQLVGSFSNNLSNLVGSFLSRAKLANIYFFGVLEDLANDPLANFKYLDSNITLVMPSNPLFVYDISDKNLFLMLVDGIKTMTELLTVGVFNQPLKSFLGD